MKKNVVLGLVGLTSMFLVSLGVSFFITVKAPYYHDKKIREQVGSQVVTVYGKRGGGSGFFVKAPSGKVYILTNYHVCQLKDENNILQIKLPGQDRTIPKQVLEMYKTHDLCLVESIEGFSGLNVANNVKVGETVAIVGHPRLFPLVVSKSQVIGEQEISLYYNKKLSMPIVFNPNSFSIDKLLQLKIYSGRGDYVLRTLKSTQLIGYSRGGSSGSPIVNFDGEVVAVLFAGIISDNMVSYGVPLRFIEEFLSVY